MILVVDSGSTKSDWVLLSDTKQQIFSTMGLNPYFHSEEIGNFDFQKPKMSRHLWLYEGLTEYAAHHTQ